MRTYLVCHPQVECVRPALIILRRSSTFDLRSFISPSATRRSSVSDLRHLFFAGRVCSTCAHLFHRLPRAGRVCSTCVIYSSQVECVGPAHYFLFYFACLSVYLTFFLYFTINFIMFFPNFSYSKYISQFFTTLYRSTCEAFHGFF